MCQQIFCYSSWQQLILPVCHASAVLCQFSALKTLVYLLPHLCFRGGVADISAARPQSIIKSLSPVDALLTGGGYISSITFSKENWEKHLKQQRLYCICVISVTKTKMYGVSIEQLCTSSPKLCVLPPTCLWRVRWFVPHKAFCTKPILYWMKNFSSRCQYISLYCTTADL